MAVWPAIEQPEFIGNDAVCTHPGGTYRGPIDSIDWQSMDAAGWYEITFAWVAKPDADGNWVMAHPNG